MSIGRVWALAVLGIALAGCQNPYIDNPVNSEAVILKSGWTTPRAIAPEPVYCYRTLAKVDCYDNPQPDYDHRLVNFFGTYMP